MGCAGAMVKVRTLYRALFSATLLVLLLLFSLFLTFFNLLSAFYRLDSAPLFYWDPDSWQSECLSQERGVPQQVLQAVKRLQLESKIFHFWGQKYHIEFFYPSQKVT